VQLLTRHPQVAQREQRRDLGAVLHQAPVSGFRITKLLLQDTEWMLDLGPDAGFKALNLIEYLIQALI
jgi:hypothetical protein